MKYENQGEKVSVKHVILISQFAYNTKHPQRRGARRDGCILDYEQAPFFLILGIVERAKRERARPPRLAFLAQGDFHARSRFPRSTMGTTSVFVVQLYWHASSSRAKRLFLSVFLSLFFAPKAEKQIYNCFIIRSSSLNE